jgi:hypothetical protein
MPPKKKGLVGRPKKNQLKNKLKRRGKKKVLPKNLEFEEGSEQQIPKKTTVYCEHCGEAIFNVVLRISGEMLRINYGEVESLHEGSTIKPHHRVSCPVCNKLTDLIL